MKYKQYVEEYNQLVNNYRGEITEELEDIPTFEPTERDENTPPLPPNPAPTPKPICVSTYRPSKDIVVNNTIAYSVYMNDKYNTIIFGTATGIGSFCFFVICAYVYKIYASKKHKLQKIRKNALNREYTRENRSSKNEDSSHIFRSFTEENTSLHDIHIADYNSQF